jgi:hypothetical protein
MRRKLIVLLASAIILVPLVGCGQPYSSTEGLMEAVKVGTWGVDALRTVDSYVTGRTVDDETPGFKPYYIINRMNETVETKRITTGGYSETFTVSTATSENMAVLKLAYAPYPDLSVVKLKSNLPNKSATFGDKLKVDGYNADTGQLSISGLMPGQTRDIVVSYTWQETRAEIPIKMRLHDSDVATVEITSDLTGENLKAVGYNWSNNTLIIDGFVPVATRVAVITYIPDLEVVISLDDKNVPDGDGYVNLTDSARGWLTLDSAGMVIPPETITPLDWVLSVPEDTELPARWVIWIDITPQSYNHSAGLTVENAYQAALRVNMR